MKYQIGFKPNNTNPMPAAATPRHGVTSTGSLEQPPISFRYTLMKPWKDAKSDGFRLASQCKSVSGRQRECTSNLTIYHPA